VEFENGQPMHRYFDINPSIIHLNHAAIAPWPLPVRDAVFKFTEENTQIGSTHYPAWLEVERSLRRQLATLVNAPSEHDIALLKSTSEALSVVAHGLEWKPGDNVVTSNEEFPSNRIVWESLKPSGVTLIEVDLGKESSPEQALISACNEQTRLLTISSIQYTSGTRVDLELLGNYCKQHNILFCIDAIQSIGALTTDVQKINADFLMADGHKWMMGPEGVALFYCRKQHIPCLKLHQYGWHMIEHAEDFSRKDWQPANSARRFECGSPNMLGIHALQAATSLILDIGMAQIEKYLLENIRYLFEQLEHSEYLECLTSRQEGKFGGIVVFKHRTESSESLYKYLMKKGVLCALRGGGVRFSPHFYTPKESIAKAVSLANAYKSTN
jgi:selenocysteine lyase/cysteine desulfurase